MKYFRLQMKPAAVDSGRVDFFVLENVSQVYYLIFKDSQFPLMFNFYLKIYAVAIQAFDSGTYTNQQQQQRIPIGHTRDMACPYLDF